MPTTTKEIGSTGLLKYSGFVNQDFLQEWQGKKAYKNANEMRLNSPVIAALLNAIEQSVRSVKWQWTSDAGEEDERLQLIQDSLDGMSFSWNDHIIEALTFLPFGFSLFEIVYRRDGGRLLWRKFAIRGQDTVYKWDIEDDGGIAGFTQQTLTNFQTVFIPIERLILYRTRVERNNPEGRSILRSAYIPYYYAKNIAQIEAIGTERDLAGLPMIKLPANADPGGDDATKATELVRRIRNDEEAGLVLPNGWEFELVSTGGTRLFNTDKIIARYEKRMLMSALAQFLVLGMDQIGSLALSKDQTDFFNMSVNATADIIAETFTKFVIPRLLLLNGMDPNGIKLEHTPAGDVDKAALATALQSSAQYITWTVEDEVWLRQLFGLPKKETEDLQAERDLKHQREVEKASSNPFLPKFGAQRYSEGDAPDASKREKQAHTWSNKFAQFFKEQRERVLKAAGRI